MRKGENQYSITEKKGKEMWNREGLVKHRGGSMPRSGYMKSVAIGKKVKRKGGEEGGKKERNRWNRGGKGGN